MFRERLTAAGALNVLFIDVDQRREDVGQVPVSHCGTIDPDLHVRKPGIGAGRLSVGAAGGVQAFLYEI